MDVFDRTRKGAVANLGFGTFMEACTGKPYAPGTHAFKALAPREYEAWFDAAWVSLWERLDKNPEIRLEGAGAPCGICKVTGDVASFSLGQAKVSLRRDISLCDFESRAGTTGRLAFARAVKERLSGAPRYLEAKRLCVTSSAGKLSRRLANVDPSGASLLLGKPRTAIRLESARPVATDQLNVELLFSTKGGRQSRMRAEIRFSHGQFNGCPEAKLKSL